jgi:hypothetical protein
MSLGIQLVDTTYIAEDSKQRKLVPAIQRILRRTTTTSTTTTTNSLETDDNYQRLRPGMILPDFDSAASVQSYLTDPRIPYPKQLVFQSMAGDVLATPSSLSTDVPSTPVPSNSLQITKVQSMDGACGIRSRSGDVMEIVYEARYYIANNNNNKNTDSPDRIASSVFLYDSSAQRGTGLPYQFVLGSGDMLPGVDQGLYDTCPGDIRILTIPPTLGYGKNRGNALFGIPPNSTLVWKVEVIAI